MRSSVAAKALMAVTGLFLIIFLLFHMFGNLKIIGGADQFNHYAAFLREILNPILPGDTFLWLFRLVLVLAVVLHIWSAVRVTKQNHRGSGGAGRYSIKKSLSPNNTYAARTMIWSGIIVVLFVIMHLLQFTIAPDFFNNPHSGPDGRAGMVYTAFGNWIFLIVYLIAIAAVCAHVSHGFWSAFATLGVNVSGVARKIIRVCSWLVGLVIFVGFMLPPFLIFFGVLN
ncbi:MAG: succinate dehydrogenase cytochrome b subunit [Corynebacterium variabile]|uniref:succinate dehydrogenase cytochrome b subunit n=1 Tax=Corynebacterium variabile TaxID=1727 RepID=UPI002648E6DE|nr:succinate dehydrogenase cytochrome b subunit [Corynebacterium variabile]MDN6537132.1 succinate dehydrogenase cytochrome b subunit [Corynebacterium variabile]